MSWHSWSHLLFIWGGGYEHFPKLLDAGDIMSLIRIWDIWWDLEIFSVVMLLFFKFVTIVTLRIIHKEIYPCFATINQLQKQKFIKILLYPDYLIEQCVETWWFFKCVLIDLGICNKTFFSKKIPQIMKFLHKKKCCSIGESPKTGNANTIGRGAIWGQKGMQGCWSNNMHPFLTVLHAPPVCTK